MKAHSLRADSHDGTFPFDKGWRPRDRREVALAAWKLSGVRFSEAPHGPLDYLAHALDDAGDVGERDSIVWACRSGGKTYLGAVATMLDLVFNPGIQVRIIAGSLHQAGHMHAHLCTLFDNAVLAPFVKGRITATRLCLSNGSRVELLAQSQRSVRGTRVHRLRCDEVELFDPAVWEAAQLVTRSETLGNGPVCGSIEALSTMHLPFGLMHRIVERARAGGCPVFKWGVGDVLGACVCEAAGEQRAVEPMALHALTAACPIRDLCEARRVEEARLTPEERGRGHLPARDAIAMCGRVPPDVWNSEMLCLTPTRRDTVFPEFDRAIHVVDEISPGVEAAGLWVCGMDFGIRNSALLWGVWDRASDVLYMVDERMGKNAILSDHVRWMREGPWPLAAWLGVDPAGNQRSDQSGRSNVELLRSEGFLVRDRRCGQGDGIGAVRVRLRADRGRPRLLVHRRCENLIGALSMYHFEPEVLHRQVPVKDGHDHPADALRYLVINLDLGYVASLGRWAG